MIHPYDPQAAMNAKYAAFARKDAATARRLGPNPDRPPTTTSSTGYATAWRDDWMPPKETLMGEPTNRVMSAWNRAIDAGAEWDDITETIGLTIETFAAWWEAEVQRITAQPSPLSVPLRPMTDEEAAEFKRKWSATTPPRASQAAGEPHSTGCDSRAASDPGGGSAGHTALRDCIRDAFHTINPDCVAYHPAECTECTTRADAVMTVIQPELDAKDAEIEQRKGDVDYLLKAQSTLLRSRDAALKRAEAAEAALATQNAENDRLDQHWADLACRTNERDQWREEARRMHQNCDHWRQRAEAAEAQLRDQNGHHT